MGLWFSRDVMLFWCDDVMLYCPCYDYESKRHYKYKAKYELYCVYQFLINIISNVNIGS